MMVADGGIIDQNFSCSKKEKFQGAGYYVSLSIPPDNVERLCLRLLQDVERIYDKYILGVSLTS
jgi:DNA transposition AAA+ family ATPase